MNIDAINAVIAHIESGNEKPVTGWIQYEKCFVGIISRALPDKYDGIGSGLSYIMDTLDIDKNNANRLFLMMNDFSSNALWDELFEQSYEDQMRTLVRVLTNLRDTGTAVWPL